jgi:hypothetical protein
MNIFKAPNFKIILILYKSVWYITNFCSSIKSRLLITTLAKLGSRQLKLLDGQGVGLLAEQ